MAFVVKDRIKETTTTTGTGTYTLAGAATGGYNTFAEIGNANKTYYACTDGTDWEVGLGTYTASGTTLSRDQIIESSNSNSAVNWGSGSKDIFVTLPSSKALVLDDNDEFNVNGGDAIRFGADQASSFSRMSLSINGSVGALGMSEPSVGNSTLNLTAQNLRGIGDGGDLHFLGATTGAGSSISLYGGNTKVFETSKTGAGASITGNLSVSGDLTVNGTTTTVNSTTVTIDDPVFTLGGDTAPASDDNKDRGIEFRWHDGSAAKVGFFGYDDSEGKLTFIPDATNASEVFSGSVGTILANVEGSLTGNADTASAADFLTGLADPNADRLLMWDDSASGHAYVTVGSNLSLSGTTLTSTDTTYSAGTGLSLSGTTFTNTAPDQTVALTGSGATSISGTYPNFTISSTNTTYTAGTGLSLSGTEFTNTAPDQTVALTGSGATSISGTYPNFTISSTDTNTTYSASTGLNLSGTTFSIDTSVVPQLSTDNEFDGSIYLQEGDQFAFYNSSNTAVGKLLFDNTTSIMTLQNHSQRVDIEGNGGVRLWYDNNGNTSNYGVEVFNLSTNVAGALNWNGSRKIQTNGAGVSVTGNISVTGTVDGRDVATDGSKLDGIEANADVTDTTNVTAAGALMDSEVTNLAQVKAFDSSDYAAASHNHDDRYYTETEADSRFVNVTGDTMSGTLAASTLTISNNATDTSAHRVSLYDSGNISYGMMLWNTNGTSGEWSTMIYGPNQSGRRISFGKITGSQFSTHSDVNEIAYFDLDDSTLRLDADAFVGSNKVFHDGYHPNADKWTTARTLSLSGDASGSVSWDGSANATLSVTVADDSHSHSNYITSNADDSMSKKLTFTDSRADFMEYNGSAASPYFRFKTSGTNNGYIQFQSNGVAYIWNDRANQGISLQAGTSGLQWYADSAYRTVWHSGNDGSGSGLDADLWDGNQFSSYLNQAVLTSSTPTFSGVNIDGNLTHNGDTDTYLSFGTDTISLVAGNQAEVTINTTGVRLGDSGNGYFQPVTGNYGSIQIDGGAHGGWEGYSIGGRVVFMHDNGSAMGLYDDYNNHWKFYAILSGATYLGYGSVYNKLETTNTGIKVNGDVNSTSDIRYKKNIETIDSALDKVQSLRGVTFDWDHEDFDTTNRATGVIAQDVEKVLPEAVREDEDGFKNVAYGNMVGLLVEAIKEQQEQIDALKKQLNS